MLRRPPPFPSSFWMISSRFPKETPSLPSLISHLPHYRRTRLLWSPGARAPAPTFTPSSRRLGNGGERRGGGPVEGAKGLPISCVKRDATPRDTAEADSSNKHRHYQEDAQR